MTFRISPILFLFAILALSAPARAQAIDWNSYCSPTAKRVLLLVDITTPYDTQDKQILVDGLQSIVGSWAMATGSSSAPLPTAIPIRKS